MLTVKNEIIQKTLMEKEREFVYLSKEKNLQKAKNPQKLKKLAKVKQIPKIEKLPYKNEKLDEFLRDKEVVAEGFVTKRA